MATTTPNKAGYEFDYASMCTTNGFSEQTFRKQVETTRDWCQDKNTQRLAEPRGDFYEAILVDDGTWMPTFFKTLVSSRSNPIYEDERKYLVIETPHAAKIFNCSEILPGKISLQSKTLKADVKEVCDITNEIWRQITDQDAVFSGHSTYRAFLAHWVSQGCPPAESLPRWINVCEWRMALIFHP